MSKQALEVWLGPLPQTADELVKRNPRTVQQRVDNMVLNGAYGSMLPYLQGTTNETSVEGKLIFDRARCAQTLRDYAVTVGDEVVPDLPMSELDRMITSTLNRNKVGRSQRRKAQQSTTKLTDHG